MLEFTDKFHKKCQNDTSKIPAKIRKYKNTEKFKLI